MSNAWGLLLIIFLLGYGVVMAPKHLARLGNYQNRVKYLEWKASEIENSLVSSENDLKDYCNKIQSTITSKKLISEKERIKELLIELKKHNIQPISRHPDDLPMTTIKDLIEINKLIKLAYDNITRLQIEQNEIYNEWQFLLRLYSKDSTPSTSASPLIPSSQSNQNVSTINKHYYLRIRPFLLIVIVFSMIVLSIIITISEVTMFMETSYCLFGMLILKSSNLFIFHLCTLIPLALLFYLSFYALFKLKLSGYFGMYPNAQTDASSLLFISKAMCKIGIPLCINFIQMIKIKHSKTILEANFGAESSQLSVNKQFVVICPTFLILLILLHYFDIFSQIGSYFGIISFGFKQAYDEKKIVEGRECLLKKHQEFLNANYIEMN